MDIRSAKYILVKISERMFNPKKIVTNGTKIESQQLCY